MEGGELTKSTLGAAVGILVKWARFEEVMESGAGGSSQPILPPTSLPKEGAWVPCLGLYHQGSQFEF